MSLLSRAFSLISTRGARVPERVAVLRRREIVRKMSTVVPRLRNLLVVAGFLYLLVLPTSFVDRRHYIDENALQPAQVNTYWNWADVQIADRYAERVAEWSEPDWDSSTRAEAIKEAFIALGLHAASQKYSFTSRVNGTNAYSILRAPKTDGAEAMVLSASWLSRNLDANGERKVNTRGVALILALANYLKKYSMWSKDIILLVSDGYVDGAQAWLDAYHAFGQKNLKTEVLSLTTGPIWVAVNIDYPYHSFDQVGLFYEGVNGHLPNLDLVNSASHILRHTGIVPVLHDDASPTSPFSSFIARSPLSAFVTPELREYERFAMSMGRQVLISASGKAQGPEAVYGRYRIDAVTMFGIPAEGPHGFHSLGRAVESTLRCVNNLLERFHQSLFLYLMKSVDNFVSVSDYLAAPLLVGAGISITGLKIWSDIGGKSRPVTQPLAILLATHLVGFAIFAGLVRIDFSKPIALFIPRVVIATLAVVPSLVSLIMDTTSYRSGGDSSLSARLECLNLILAGLVISTTATLNFGGAVVLSILFFPLIFTRKLGPGRRIFYIINRPTWSGFQQVVILLLSPPVLWSMWRTFNGPSADRWLRSMLEDYHVSGTVTLPYVFLVVVPLFLQASTAALL